MSPLTTKLVISTKDASRISGYSADHIGYLCRTGKIKAERIGKNWIIDQHSLLSFMEEQGKESDARAEALSKLREQEYQAVRARELKTAFTPVPATLEPEGAGAPSLRLLPVLVTAGVLVFMVLGTSTLSTTLTKHSPASAQVASVSTPFFEPASLYFQDVGRYIASLFAPKIVRVPETPVYSSSTAPIVVERTVYATTTVYEESKGTNQYITNNYVASSGVSREYLEQRLRESRLLILDRRNSTRGSGGGGGSGSVTSVDASGGSTGLSFTGGPITSSGTLTLAGTLAIANGGTNATSFTSGEPVYFDGASLVSSSTLSQNVGGTGITSYTSGDIIYANANGTLAKLPVGSAGQVLKVSGGLPSWGADITSGGGSGAWATSTDNLLIYPSDPNDVVVIGASATSTTGNILEVVGNALYRNTLTSYGLISAPRFTATTTTASVFPYASSTGISSSYASSTNLFVGSFTVGGDTFTELVGTGLQLVSGALSLDASGDWTGTFDGFEGSFYRDNSFSTTSANYWESLQTARTADDLTNNSIENLSDVADGITEDFGDLLYWNGSAWADIATSSLGISAGSSFPFTPAANWNSTSTLLQLAGGVMSTASSTLHQLRTTYASSTYLSASIASTSALVVSSLGASAGSFLAVNASGAVIATSAPSSGVGAGTAGQIPYYAANGSVLSATSSIQIDNDQIAISPGGGGGEFTFTTIGGGLQFGANGAGSIDIEALGSGTVNLDSDDGSVSISGTNAGDIDISSDDSATVTVSAGTSSALLDLSPSGGGGIRLSTALNSYLIGQNFGLGTTAPSAKLGVEGNIFVAGNIVSTSSRASTFPYASTTGITTSYASTSALIVSSLNASGCDLKSNSTGVIFCGTDADEDTTYTAGTGLALLGTTFSLDTPYLFTFPFTPASWGNSTSTVLGFLGGFFSNASSTIHQLYTQYASSTYLSAGTASTSAAVISGIGSATNNIVTVTPAGVIGASSFSALGALTADNNKWATSTGAFVGIFPNAASVVGIGTSTPRALLHLATSTAPQLVLSDTFASNNSWALRSINGNLYFASTSASTLATSTTAQLSISGASGYIGIGTINPGLKLEVVGTTGAPATSGTTQTGIARFSQAGAGVLDIGVISGGVGAWLQSTRNSDLSIWDELLLNPNGGDVGIGTTTPDAQLVVTDSADTLAALTIASNRTANSAAAAALRFSATQSVAPVDQRNFEIMSVNGTAGNTLRFRSRDDAYTALVSDILILTHAGNVGVGTTTPGTKLSVNGDGVVAGDFTARRIIATSTQSASTFTYASSTYLSLSGTASTSNLTISGIANASTQCLQISSAGVVSGTGSACGAGAGADNNKWATTTGTYLGITPNAAAVVGIGTSTPRALLHLATSTAPQLVLSDSFSANNSWALRSIAGNFYIASASASTLSTSTTAQLSISGASGYIGIGTANPQKALHIHSPGANFTQWTNDTTGSATSDGLYIGQFAANAQAYVINQEASTLVLGTSGLGHFYINSLGNVGIGTSTPGAGVKLSVNGNIFVGGNIVSTSSQPNIFPYASTTNITSSGSAYFALSGGGVGIGSSSPILPLSVGANGSYEGFQYSAAFSSITTSGPGLLFTGNTGYDGRNWHLVALGSGNVLLGNPGSFSIADRTAGVSRLLIDSAGRVGIGTTTPQTLLTLSTTTASQLALSSGTGYSQVALRNSFGNFYLSTTTTDGFATSTLPALTIFNTGRVGIATTSPAYPLEVYANTSTQNGNYVAVFLRTGGAGGVRLGSNNGAAIIGAVSANSGSSQQLAFNVSNSGTDTEVGRFTATGNFGIGTSSPGAKLSVEGDSFFAGYLVSTSSKSNVFPYASSTYVSISGTASTSQLTVSGIANASTQCLQISSAGVVSGSGGACGGGGAGDSKWATTTGSFLGITPAGAAVVGIGTSTPRALLHLATGTAPQLALSDTFGSNGWALRSIMGNFYLATNSASTFATSTTAQLTVSGTNGYVGIGTAAPNAPLVVSNGAQTVARFVNTGGNSVVQSEAGSGYASFYAIGSGTNNSYLFLGNAGGEQGRITSENGGNLYFSNTASALVRMTITSTGLIGIGTTSPGAKLAVETTGSEGIHLNVSGGASQVYLRGYVGTAQLMSILRPASSNDTQFTSWGDLILSPGQNETGYVGIGTTSPFSLLSVSGGKVTFKSTASTTAAFAVENNFGQNVFQVDTLDNSTTIFSVATTTGATYFVVGASGNVGVGTTTPWRTLSIAGTGAWSGLTSAASGNVVFCINATSKLLYEGSSATTCTPSSAQFKNTIATSTAGLAELKQLRPVTFFFNDQGDPTEQLGFIAEEVYLVEPRLVNLDANGKPFSLKLDNFISLAVSSIQEVNSNLEAIALLSASTTPAAQEFADSFFENLFARVSEWLADASNGVGNLFANQIHTKQICVAKSDGTEFCADGDMLAELAEAASGGGGSSSSPPPSSPSPEPAPEPTPEPSSEPAPEPTPESPPEPDSTSSPQAEPPPEPSPTEPEEPSQDETPPPSEEAPMP